VPFLKYPANPPSIGNPDTIKERGGLYLIMVLGSVVVGIAAVWAGQRLKARFGNWNATLIAGAGFIVVMSIVMAILPPLGALTANTIANGHVLTETPLPLKNPAGLLVFPGFDADTLFRFRLYSVLAQVIYWTVLALGFAPLADKVFERHSRPTQQEMAAQA
jgi:hypothetical protein